ncbi:MAG: hypothetical protein JWM95_832 [Gemmatimonadetes bacterium]|nr:hypothetical protein [Gemmatimonadota bacterium]
MVIGGARLAAAQSGAPAFVRGESAFLAADIAGAEQAFRSVLASDTVRNHRVQATRVLATIAWRIRADTVAASRLLAEGARIQDAKPLIDVERARMLMANGNFTAARAMALSALAESNSMADSAGALVALVESIADPRLQQLRRGERPAAMDSATLHFLHTGVMQLRTIVRQNPGQTRLAKALIMAAAVAGDGPSLLDGWRSYYLIGTGDTSRGLLHDPRRVLEAALPGYGHAAGTPQAASITKALMDSRLFDAALVVAAATADARLDEIIHYARFLKGVQLATEEYYRQLALGKTDTTEWRRKYLALGAVLWPHLGWTGAMPRLDRVRLASELDARFGAYVNFGVTSGYNDLHFGHRVVDERRQITQYGHSADLRFVALDGMVSDGFQTWLWDGRAGHGGWATKDLIIQVRPEYADGTLDAWSVITDSTRRALRNREIAADSAADLIRAETTPVAYFPSVADRMQRDGQQQLLDSLSSQGLAGTALEAAYERLYGDAIQETSIFVHEGRHAIDKRLGSPTAGADLEFNAKLSELAFSPRPRLAITAMMLGNLGDNTPHGKANERVARGLLAWMEAHTRDIRGANVRLPLLPQLPLLNDALLRAAAASMDPMARIR